MSRPRTKGHGDYGYAKKEKCHCSPCRVAIRRYDKRLRYEKECGIERRVDADIVREHLAYLQETATLTQIAHTTGIAKSVVMNIVLGKPDQNKPPARFVLKPTAEKLLACTPAMVAATPHKVPSIGLQRRIRALQYMGHSPTTLAEHLGKNETAVWAYLEHKNAWNTTVDEVHELYVKLRDTPGTDEVTRFKAYRNDWKAPWCWDDETIDDPDTKPHPAACIAHDCTRAVVGMSLCRAHREYVISRGATKKARYYSEAVRALKGKQIQDSDRTKAEIRALREVGYDTPEEISYRLGLTPRYVERFWEETHAAR